MARPKTYTDEDVIRISTQLSADGKKPTGWLIKEALGRGKIASIQADLDRLVTEGKIPEIQTQPSESANPEQSEASTFELPAELEDMLSFKELELGKILREMTISMNDKANIYYEALMGVRVRELDAQSDLMTKAKAIAEQATRDMEMRLKKQVERNEVQEEQIESLETRLSSSKSEKSELVQTISQLSDSFNKVSEKAEQQYVLLDELRQTISDKDKEYTAIEVKLEHVNDEAKKSQLQLADLLAHHESVKTQLAESSTLLKSTQGSLSEAHNQNNVLRKENTELAASSRLLQKNIADAESEVILLHKQKQRLEREIADLQNLVDSSIGSSPCQA
ncbi:hypothetical protein [Vibrio agarivorans]|uniref:KfrA N-terminal DNA-binding domain-containing protein n=1 Tax=Vibrio agarivorans TaxID=153622 RepID=A0ABT7Y0V4_9VIBR|nr:hypothetical protein [Vibrio agarivorans]MDN2481673.1 hypothetical protein [Vibrio agarivorans]